MLAEWVLPRRVLFGPGASERLPSEVESFGRRALLVTGSRRQPGDRIEELLQAAAIECVRFAVTREPTIEDAEQARALGASFKAKFVVAIGGGSALDVGKAAAGLLANPGELLDYLEVVGKARPLSQPPVPFVAVPTTAGTGSEATRNAVLEVPEHRVKVSLRSPLLVPALVILDPSLTLDLPKKQTVTSGLDAIVQLLEAFVSARANLLTDAYCRQGLRSAFPALERAVRDGRDIGARGEMLFAAFCSGVALANAGLGAVHGFAGPLGGLLHAPHGALCAALCLPVIRTNMAALRQRAPDSPALERYREIATLVTRRTDALAEDLVEWLAHYLAPLDIPRLRDLGLTASLFPLAVEKARCSSSMKSNPIALTDTELMSILEQAL